MAKLLSCGVEFMRGILLLLNIIFVIVGLGLIGLGIYIKIDTNFSVFLNKLTDVSDFEGQSLGFLAFIMIGGGIFTILIALFGCIGTLRHNRCLLYMYAIILSILMILELTGFIMALVYKGKLEGVYKNSLAKVFVNALKNNETKVLEAFHKLEDFIKCCGINGTEDYTDNQRNATLSCYEHPKGCSEAIIDLLEKNLPIIGGTLGGVLLFELISLIGAIILAVAIKNAPDTIYSSKPEEVLHNIVPGRRRNYRQIS